MENDLYWKCRCGYENLTAPSVFRYHEAPTHECAGCHDRMPITRADCTAERRTPAVEVGATIGEPLPRWPEVRPIRIETPAVDRTNYRVEPWTPAAAIERLNVALDAMTKERDEARAEVVVTEDK